MALQIRSGSERDQILPIESHILVLKKAQLLKDDSHDDDQKNGNGKLDHNKYLAGS